VALRERLRERGAVWALRGRPDGVRLALRDAGVERRVAIAALLEGRRAHELHEVVLRERAHDVVVFVLAELVRIARLELVRGLARIDRRELAAAGDDHEGDGCDCGERAHPRLSRKGRTTLEPAEIRDFRAWRDRRFTPDQTAMLG